jgi:hypothetical protein
MGRYESKARHHAEKIRYYHEHAGPAGYSQATYHWGELCNLMWRASRSKSGQADAVLIQLLTESAEPLMHEMKKREEEQKDIEDRRDQAARQ